MKVLINTMQDDLIIMLCYLLMILKIVSFIFGGIHKRPL